MPLGKTPEVGEIFRQPVLANSMKQLVWAEQANLSEGRSAALAATKDAFYKGDIAKLIDRYYKKIDGLLRYEDFAAYTIKVEEPLKTLYKGIEVYSPGADTQGMVLLQALNMLENYDLNALKHNSPEYIHLLIEVLKLAMADREKYYGDPDFVKVPFDGLLSKEYAQERIKSIDMNKS
jgi:gamma-glutamyltranspeptidase/glutathione hydrolase